MDGWACLKTNENCTAIAGLLNSDPDLRAVAGLQLNSDPDLRDPFACYEYEGPGDYVHGYAAYSGVRHTHGRTCRTPAMCLFVFCFNGCLDSLFSRTHIKHDPFRQSGRASR